MSSSDESEDENLKRLLEAADPSLFTNALYKKSDSGEAPSLNEELKKEETAPKSQRYLDVDETFDTDLKIPQSMQDYIFKRLSTVITNQVEFVAPHENGNLQTLEKKIKKKWKSRVRLLQDSDIHVKYLEEHWDLAELPQKKPTIKRRVVESDGINEEERIRSSAVSPNIITSGDEVKSWAKRKEKKVFKYKKAKSGGTLHFIEPENEFTIIRKKNCWSEKYIAKNKRK